MAVKWTRQHEAERAHILELLRERVKPFEDMSDAATKARRALPFPDWCRVYLPLYFSEPSAAFQERAIEEVGEPGLPTFIDWFRGAGKSVMFALARPLWRTLNRQVPYWLYGANVQKLAAQNMDFVRIQLQHNERIACDYPGLRVEGAEEEWQVTFPAEKSAQGRWALRATKFEAFGIGMSVRGKRFGEHRPLEFVGDDMEDEELARSPRREDQLWDWMMDGVLPALEPGVYIFTVLGTMFGVDCMMERARRKSLEKDPSGRALMRVLHQPAVTESGRSIWPERFPDEFLERVRAQIGLRNWLRNYALSADDPTKPFQPGWFESRYSKVDRGALDVVAFLDPAISESASACPRALVCVGADRKTGERYVLDAWISQGGPTEMVEQLFLFHKNWRPRLITVESNGGFALIRPLLEMREQQKGGYRLPVRYQPHSTSKELRIEALAPEMQTGRWRWPEHPNEGVRTLQDQFLSYPEGFVDGPDATAGCGEMLPDAFRPRATDAPMYRSLRKRRDLSGVL